MRKVELRMNEIYKYKAIKECCDNGCSKSSKNRAATKLNLSKRQIDRLIIKYKERGKSAFIHGNRSKKPNNKIDSNLSESIIHLYRYKYQDFNFSHFLDMLEEYEDINVSYKFLYNLLMRNDFKSPKIQKRTKRRIKKEELLTEKRYLKMEENELSVVVDHQIRLEDAHPRQEKPKYFGEVIEMDGSDHLWFGSFKTCLHLAIDVSTGTVVGGFFQEKETLKGYYTVFNQILIKYGIPFKFKTDNRTVFYYNNIKMEKRTSDKDVLTQFGYACSILGTELETTSVSQAKGTIERANGTFQGRLINELKLNGITTMDEANVYLINKFIPSFNKKFSRNYKNVESVFVEAPTPKKLNYILAVLTERKIDNGNSIKFKNNYYQPYKNNELVCFMPKTDCLVIEAFDGSLALSIDNDVYQLRRLKVNKQISNNIDYETIINKTQTKYIPEMTLLLKIKAFRNQIKNAHN